MAPQKHFNAKVAKVLNRLPFVSFATFALRNSYLELYTISVTVPDLSRSLRLQSIRHGHTHFRLQSLLMSRRGLWGLPLGFGRLLTAPRTRSFKAA